MGWALPATLGVMGVGGVLNAAGTAEQASASATSARYQSAVAANNAAIARNKAETAIQIGERKAEQQGLKNRAQMGAIVAQQAGNGLDVNTGSPKQVQESQRQIGQLDTMTIRSDAAREAHGYNVEAANFDAESKMAKKAAKRAKQAGQVGILASLLDSAASMGGAYLSFAGTGGGVGAPTQLSTGANVLNTNYWAPMDTGTIY